MPERFAGGTAPAWPANGDQRQSPPQHHLHAQPGGPMPPAAAPQHQQQQAAPGPAPLSPLQDMQRAQDLAASLRAACDVLKGGPK